MAELLDHDQLAPRGIASCSHRPQRLCSLSGAVKRQDRHRSIGAVARSGKQCAELTHRATPASRAGTATARAGSAPRLAPRRSSRPSGRSGSDGTSSSSEAGRTPECPHARSTDRRPPHAPRSDRRGCPAPADRAGPLAMRQGCGSGASNRAVGVSFSIEWSHHGAWCVLPLAKIRDWPMLTLPHNSSRPAKVSTFFITVWTKSRLSVVFTSLITSPTVPPVIADWG